MNAPLHLSLCIGMKDSTFEALTARYRAVILGQCQQLHARAPHLCEVSDLVQAAHIRIWERTNLVQKARHPRSYIAALAHNAACNHLEEISSSFASPIDLASLEAS